MLRYEVTLTAPPELLAEIEQWMRAVHIPGIWATGCFAAIRLDRTDEQLRTCYHARAQADLDRYLAEHAPATRREFTERYPSGVQVERAVWREVEGWGRRD